MQFVCTSILTVIISVIDCAQPLTVIPIKLQPFGCNQAVIGRIYLQCSENHQKRPGSERVNNFAISLLFLKSVGANPMNKQNFLKNRGCKCTHSIQANDVPA